MLIGFLPAWRGLPAAAAAALQAQKDVSDAAVKTAQAATIAAAGTPGAPAAKAAEETAKGVAAAAMATAISAAVGASATSGGAPDIHTCPVPMGLVPHGPGVVIDGSKTVLINGLPACRVGDSILEALGPPNKIVMGHMKTFIGEGTATKSSGGGSRDLPKQSNNSPGGGASGAAGAGAGGGAAPAQSTFEKNKAAAIEKIKNSKFGQTEEGKKVIKKIEELDAAGKIKSTGMGENTRGEWGGGEIRVNNQYEDDPDAIASELVHEATHAVNEDEFPASKTKITVDEEMRTNENQLDFYEEQREDGFRDPELEDRRDDRADGKLRDNVRRRYPNAPEHL
ncbi:MAG: hypothetical protein BGP06_01380 [Rhizobiales bacterium 65-9]|nr:MAG: hypothetical protein BGP06_01380 [Rhizobiales bacterium 65-9]